jgi:hypothetical protein
MSTTTPHAFGPYPTPAELAKGKRKALVSLVVAMGAVVLSVVASRTVADERLVVVYLLAGGLHFAASVAASVRWSRTPDFGAAD